jgi:hypothetical protein
LLTAFPQRVAVAARERLERLGITIVTGARVVAADAEGRGDDKAPSEPAAPPREPDKQGRGDDGSNS